MAELKPGDLVTITQDGHAAQGKTGVVESVTPSNHYSTFVIFDKPVPTIGDSDVFHQSDLELIQEPSEVDNVNSPSHYQFPGGVEVIQITEHLNFCKGNAVKYLTRSGRKAIADEVEDLKKAVWYINREIARLESTE